MQLTKTDFIHYLNCPNSLWLFKNRRDIYEQYRSEMSLFFEKLIREGYEVERYARDTYPTMVDLKSVDLENVRNSLARPGFYAQPTLVTPSGLLARPDVVQVHDDSSISIHEIKSSTSVKTDKKHNHLKDICFQRYVAEQNGYSIKDMYHVHLNKDFVKHGDIDAHDLIVKENVSEKVAMIYEQTIIEIQAAIDHIHKPAINEEVCSCLDQTRANHCDTFSYFNKSISDYAIYELYNIRAQKIQELRDMSIVQIVDIPDGFKLSEYQQLQRQSIILNGPIIEFLEIENSLNALEFPLYFFDYETLPFAVPRVDGYKPHQHTPIQYSLHVLSEDGGLEHFEYLATSLEKPEALISSMRSHIGPSGTLISWYAPFEKTRNKEMGEMYPEQADFLSEINIRTFDLMDIFKKDYVDRNFRGSLSIKKVQPVLVPGLSYNALQVQSGTMAIDSAERLYELSDFDSIQELREAMLRYCELDTLAMVEIYKRLRAL